MSSSSIFSFLRTRGSLLVRNTSAVAAELVEDVEALGRGEVERQAPLAPVGVLEQRMDVAADRHHAGRGQAAHGVAPLDRLDLDDVGAPVGQEGRGRRHERVLGHFEDADALHHCGHRIPPSVRLTGCREPGGGTNSESDIDVDISPGPGRPPPAPPASPDRHLDHHLAHGPALGHVVQRGHRVGQVERGADERGGAAQARSSSSSASLRAISSGMCVAKSRNWNPRTRTPLSSTKLRGIRGMAPRRSPR